MAGFGNSTRRYPRSSGRTGSRSGPDRATLGIIGAICAIAGFFVAGIILGPAAVVCGWLAMGRSWNGSASVPALIAVVLGGIVTVLSIIALVGAASLGFGAF
ncbi:small hydrophobic protein [Streptomyces sp. CRN 30]|uniref:small hydrophobic protein n=1 Tax=Streptomyces sp. CRN 30 TaxID=3075613 RepID=UPI002A822887|nr:small hydrophobic protein [Streptomyces sp. CRN 30]